LKKYYLNNPCKSLDLFPVVNLLTRFPLASTLTKVCFVVTPYFCLRAVLESKSTFITSALIARSHSALKFLSAATHDGHHEA